MPTLLQRARSGLARLIGGTASATQVRRFNAAKHDRLSADWLATENSLNEELRSDLTRLRSRGRNLVQNNDYAVKFRGMVTDNIIGPAGIRLQMRVEDAPGKPDQMANAAIERAWAEWCQGCDITGRQTMRDVCETLVGGLPSDGEFLARIVIGPDAGNRFGIALQIIDVDRIDTTYHTSNGPNGNAVVMGIEVDAYRRPVAVWVFAAHPSDGANSSRQRVRLPVDETLHRFKVERAEQMRGIPWMSAGMLSLYHLGNFKLAALLAAEHGANHYGFFTTPDGQAPVGSIDGATGETITTSQPGTYDTLPVGVSFTPHQSKYPDTVFGPFVKTTLQRIASGWRVAYHSLANDLEGVSYSSIRSGSLEERDRWAADQQWFIDAFLEPVFAKWLQVALLSGAITMPNGSPLPASKIDKFKRHEWQPRRWEWVDPEGDMKAKILAVKAGLMAPQDLAAAMGYDFDDTLAAIAMAQKQAAALGVQLSAYDPTPGAQPNAPPAATAAKSFDLDKWIDQSEKMHLRMLASIPEMFKQLAARETPLPVQHHIHLPEQRNEIHNHLPAPVVQTEVHVPETTVHVEAVMPAAPAAPAPVVHITNDVQPAPVTVNNAFAAKATQTVNTNPTTGDIVSTVTVYEGA
jgi:lambda family phage portal protein